MRETMLTEFVSSELTVRSYLDGHRSWISAKLGCRMDEAVLFELDFPMAQAAVSFLLAGARLRSDASSATRQLQRLLESVELPPDSYPAFQVHVAREQRGRITGEEWRLRRNGRMDLLLCGCAGSRGPLWPPAFPSWGLAASATKPVSAYWSIASVRRAYCKSYGESPRDAILPISTYSAVDIERLVGLFGMTWCSVTP